MPKTKRIGRPPLPKRERKGKIVPMRMKPEDVKLFERAARKSKLTLSEWMRMSLRVTAVQLIESTKKPKKDRDADS